MDAYRKAAEWIQVPLCFNGEINSAEDLQKLKELFPQTERFMVGRGALRHPGLIGQLRGVEQKSCMRAFHDEIFAGYREIMSGDKNTLFKMKELWSYWGEDFTDVDKYLKRIKKANRLSDYQSAVNELFSAAF